MCWPASLLPQPDSREYQDACDLWDLYSDTKNILIAEAFGDTTEKESTQTKDAAQSEREVGHSLSLQWWRTVLAKYYNVKFTTAPSLTGAVVRCCTINLHCDNVDLKRAPSLTGAILRCCTIKPQCDSVDFKRLPSLTGVIARCCTIKPHCDNVDLNSALTNRSHSKALQ